MGGNTIEGLQVWEGTSGSACGGFRSRQQYSLRHQQRQVSSYVIHLGKAVHSTGRHGYSNWEITPCQGANSYREGPCLNERTACCFVAAGGHSCTAGHVPVD